RLRSRGAAVRTAGRRSLLLAGLLALPAGMALLPPLEPGYATSVVAFVEGPGASSDPELALGAPIGGGLVQGSVDTYSPGSAGSLTLHMEPPVVDSGGADLLVCENPFLVTGTLLSFVEAVFVEVSSDGVNFARMPNSYTGPNEALPAFTGIHPARYRGFAGVMPVSADPPLVDPLDVTSAGGDTFDLRELSDHPLVQAELLDLTDVRYVRLVDVEAGTDEDSAGHTVWDAGIGGLASCDIDAVVGLNTTENQNGGRPHVETDLVNGYLVIVLEDLNGLADIKPGIALTVNGFPVPFGALLPYLQLTSLSPTKVEFKSLGPIPPGLFPAVLRVRLRDGTGMYGGDGVTIQ
ncbi:MAG TPA: hypothetical protein VFD43_10230, partial [Planctomycetota bacterium]|nr:hypothetical protein [Planctomycetota bacterium]